MVSFTLYSLNYHKYSQHFSASSHITKSHQYISHLHSIFCMNLFVGKLWRSEGMVIHPTSRSGTLNGAPRLQDGIAKRNNLVPQTNNMLFMYQHKTDFFFFFLSSAKLWVRQNLTEVIFLNAFAKSLWKMCTEIVN